MVKIARMLLVCLLGIIASATAQDEEQAFWWKHSEDDSVLKSYSVEEFLEFRDYYEQELKNLEWEKSRLLERGIRDGEEFLSRHKDSPVTPKVIARLAEMYYQFGQDEYLDRMAVYDEQYESYEAGELTTPPEEPQKDFTRAVDLYQMIIDGYPESELVDDAIYNKAYLLADSGERDSALVVYEELVREFPESPYIPEALMRIGEHYFNPPRNDIERAIEYFTQVLAFLDSPKYDEALYMLGWSYYRLSDYPRAIGFFTTLADDVERSKKLDPGNQYTNPSLRNESVEYIAISFLDFGGSDKAVDYLRDIGGREYGVEILKTIGDVYLDVKEEYEDAVDAYELILRIFPNSAYAPLAQARIAEAYRHLQDERMAYLSRDLLYTQYRAGSDWWNNVTDEKAKEKALSLAESSLRDNINLLLARAEETGDKGLYLQAVNDCRNYLYSFPADSNASTIHWNMAVILDTKLHNYDEAFDEYVRISNLYWDQKYQRMAAENAIVVAKESLDKYEGGADELVAQPTDSLQELVSNAAAAPLELSPLEERLAKAYDNFARIFPHDTTTSVILANAGALYYKRHQFKRALVYYNTLLRHFPESQEVDYARFTIMESYFGKADYRSTEIVARRIRESTSSPELREKAERRLAESIFLSAEGLAEAGEPVTAGDEFTRVADEAPTAEFAHLALFRAGLEYDKAKEFPKAIGSYNRLLDEYPKSEHYLDALNNLAFDYGESGEFRNAGRTYERLHEAHTQVDRKQDALYNASVFYVRAESWNDAIRANRVYVDRYPTSPDATDMHYEIANYYLKLGDFDNASEIYGEFAEKYPNSPRVVETYYRRGEYFLERNRIAAAKTEFGNAIKKSDEFKSREMPANEYYAAEALFLLTNIEFEEFDQIEFRQPKSRLDNSVRMKRDKLKRIIDGYTRVASYGTLRLYEAMHKIGRSYEEFAETWANQELPPMDATRRVVAEKEINESATELYEEASMSFQKSLSVLTKLAGNYENVLRDSLAAQAGRDTSRVGETRVVDQDSTLQIAHRWIDRTKEKISEVVYDIAELNTKSVQRLLEAPVPPGLDIVTELEYRKQVIVRAVKPLVDDIIAAHIRNLREAEELSLDNQWVELSRNRIVSVSNVLPEEFGKLSRSAQSGFKTYLKSYLSYLKDAESSTADMNDITDFMGSLIEFSEAYASASLRLYGNTLNTAAEQAIEEDKIAHTKEIMVKGLYAVCAEWDSLANLLNNKRREAEDKFKKTDVVEYEDAMFILEDDYYLARDNVKKLLEDAYEVIRANDIMNPWSDRLTVMLVRKDPEQYASLLGYKIKKQEFGSDGTWKASTDYSSGWTKTEFPDGGWTHAESIPGVTGHTTNSPWIWTYKLDHVTSAPDSLSLGDSTSVDSGIVVPAAPVEVTVKRTPVQLAFFRKVIDISGMPVSGEVALIVDNEYDFFVNGEYISSASYEASEWNRERLHNFSDFLRPGRNTIAIEARDPDKTGGGLLAKIIIESIPDWDPASSLKYDPETTKTMIMDKNIITY